MIVRVNNFFYAIALALVFSNASCEAAKTIENKFGDSSFEITVKCSNEFADSTKETVILNTIQNLVKEVDSTVAAKEYLDYVKSVFEKLKNNQFFNSIKGCKSVEESSLKVNQFIQEWSKDLSKKENVLKQSVYFAALSDEAINDINMAMGMTMQSFMMELNAIAMEANKKAQEARIAEQVKEDEAVENNSSESNSANQMITLSDEENEKLQLAIQEKMDGLGDKVFDAIKDALSKYYTI